MTDEKKAPPSGEDALAALERQVERQEARIEIENLMSRYMWNHTASDQDATFEMFALKTPGVRMEFNQRVFAEYDGLYRNLIKWQNTIEADLTGMIFQHDLMTPYIVVADDCQTAIGLWNCMGMETLPEKTGGKASIWSWGKNWIDFIKEDGQWKFWHFRGYPVIKTRFDGKGWADEPWLNDADYSMGGGASLGHDRGSAEFAPDCLKYVCSFRKDRADCDVHNCYPPIPPVRYAAWRDEWNAVDRQTDDPERLADSYPPIRDLRTQQTYRAAAEKKES